jgi:predicted MPP superfamily phosphohydrolase
MDRPDVQRTQALEVGGYVVTEARDRVVLVHLSDIHLKVGEYGEEERNKYLRGELERDLAQVRDRLGSATAILVTGDIAFSGKREEYDLLREWLSKVSSIVGAEPTSVLCVPGNHDVNWDEIGVSGKALREKLKSCGEFDIDRLLDECLAEPGRPILTPLTEYNEFAAFYECAISDRLSWETRLSLQLGYTLVFRGATTVAGSGPDSDGPGSLVIGRNQLLFEKSPEQIHVLLAHHDSHFWRDRLTLEKAISGRVAVQLYGHTHDPRIQVIDDSVVVTAGASQPDEGPSWQPYYNWLVLEAHAHPEPLLTVDVWPRRFRPDGFASDSSTSEPFQRYICRLDQIREPPPHREEVVSMDETPAVSPRSPLFEIGGEPELSRRILLAVQRMGIGDRYQLFERLGLASPDDVALTPIEFLTTAMTRARQSGGLEAIAEALGVASLPPEGEGRHGS